MSKRTHNSSRRGGGKGITFLNATLLSDSDDCIEWPFYRMKNGYGQVCLHTGMALAHRKMCEMAHSRKPEWVQDVVDSRLPDARRIELFARRQREGWTCWGNDADRFDAQNRHPATVRPRL